MSKIQIRPAAREDADEFLRIEKENFSDPWSKAIFLETLEHPQYINLVAERTRDDRIDRCVNVSSVAPADLVAEAIKTECSSASENTVMLQNIQTEGMEIGGFLCIAVIADEGHIDNVSVSQVCRRQGIGEQLLAEGMRQAREQGVRDFTLEVRAGNTAARTLYEKAGFVCEGVRKNYYERPTEDAAIYWKHEQISE